MDVIDLSRRLSLRALRRLAKRYRRQLIGGASVAVLAASSVAFAVPALAHDGKNATPLAACTTPLVTPCAPVVTPTPSATVSDYMVTLPGIGTLNITLDPSGAVSAASVSGVDPAVFTSTVKVDGDSDKVTVTLTSVADSTVVYKVSVGVKAVAGGAPIITAKLKAAEKEKPEVGDNEKGETGDHPTLGFSGGDDGDHHGAHD